MRERDKGEKEQNMKQMIHKIEDCVANENSMRHSSHFDPNSEGMGKTQEIFK